MSAVWIIPRESVEWIGPVTLTGDTGTLALALVAEHARPAEADWKTPTMIGVQAGYLVSGFAPGRYRLWAKIADSPETPVFDDVAVVLIT